MSTIRLLAVLAVLLVAAAPVSARQNDPGSEPPGEPEEVRVEGRVRFRF